MDVLTGERMKKVDEETIARFCPGLELMERAGRQVAEFILDRFPEKGFKAAIFVGPGNNGGDALVVARRLNEDGRACSVHYLSSPERFTMDALKNYQRLQRRLKSSKSLKEINSTRTDWSNILKKDLMNATLIVDGLFGTGLARDLEGRAADVVRLINERRLPVVSIDTPSGIHSDTGEVLGSAVRAHFTVTMGYPKLGMLFHPARQRVGELVVADLGFPEEVLQVHSLGVHLLDRAEAVQRIVPRDPAAHKYGVGTVLLVAGSRAYTGAAMLAAEAALRSGCGMVFVAVPESIRPVVQTRVREVIVIALPETAEGTIAPGALSVLQDPISACDVIALGPGLGRHAETSDFVKNLVAESGKPLIVDADGINAFAGEPELLEGLRVPTVLTPHSGELQRLVGRDVPTDPLDKVETTRGIAKKLGVTLVHKGAPTLVASPDGDVWINHVGNSALATAGTGDVLTGMVAGLQAQGATGLAAALVACYLHGRAGVRASSALGVRGVIAGDLLRFVGGAMRELENIMPDPPESPVPRV
ncbi:MAG: NAD(P)H-hydrate dehydratase [Candidatus Krumholzibacteria bacterium]